MKRIVFLDIDGVLNNAKSSQMPLAPIEGYDFNGRHGVGLNQFDPDCVDRLNRIIDATGADIVISSDWRLYFFDDEEFDALRKFIHGQGIKGKILCGTDCYNYADRVREIETWVKENKVDRFVILEDWCDMRHLEEFTARTNSDEGLAECHVEQAIGILNA